MKLLRYGAPRHEKPGVLDAHGRIRDLSHVVPDIAGDVLLPASIERLRAIDPDSLPLVGGSPRIGPCVGRVGKFLCAGLNYSDHAAESGMAVPKEPIIFMKATTCIGGPNDDIQTPKNSTKLDYEAELGIVIGAKAQYVSEEKALEHVAGYTIVNDVSERAFQMQSTQWDKGKGFDTSGPIGPWLVTTDEITDPQTLDIWLDVNGERRQTSNTKNMIFNCAKIVSYCSHYMTLLPGDIICTGTPHGVALGIKDRDAFLKPGDIVTLGIKGLGEQRQKVLAWTGK